MTGKVTRRIKEWHLNSGVWEGPAWSSHGVFNKYQMGSPTFDACGSGKYLLCTHFAAADTGWTNMPVNTIQVPSGIDSSQSVILCKPVIDGVVDLASWHAWLNANDPVIYYVRATPTVESIDPITVPTYLYHTELSAGGAELSASLRTIDISGQIIDPEEPEPEEPGVPEVEAIWNE